MIFELKTISRKKYLISSLISIPFILGLSIGLGILTGVEELVFIVIPGFIIGIIVSHKFSKEKTTIVIDNEHFFIQNNEKVNYDKIIGYYLDETSPIQSGLSFRMNSNKTINIISSSIGKEGRNFKEFTRIILSKIQKQNPTVQELEFQDVHVKQMNILRPILIVLGIFVILLDIVVVYIVVIKDSNFPLQFFFVNIILIGLLPYLRKSKK